MTPLEYYHADLATPGFQHDAAQARAVEYLQSLYDTMLGYRGRGSRLQRLFHKPEIPQGLYMWGGTGRGKTFLVDRFYATLPFSEKNRMHYDRFMTDIHERLRDLTKTPDPLRIVARQLSRSIRLLCLDEFHVDDIGDAMIMAGLLKALMDEGIVLVATSNIAIRELYRNGLQRERFLPAIDLLLQHTREVDLGDGTDYRYQNLCSGDLYHISSTAAADFLNKRLQAIAPCPPKQHRQIRINGRDIDYVASADDVIWFDFDAICNTPRSPSDYIALAETHHTLLLSHVYRMGEGQDDVASRFIHLIDALYDHHVKLIMTAECEAGELYHGRALAGAFKRTASRLREMSSQAYLATPHLARLAR